MNVLHIIDTMSLGGAQTIIKAVFEKLKDDPRLYLFALRKKDITIEVDHPNIFVFDSTAKYSFAPLKAMATLIREKHITVLHCHLFRSEIFGYLLKKFYFPNIKLIFHEHGQIVGSDLNSKVEDAAYVGFKKVSKGTADLGIAVSNAMKEHLVRRASIPENNITTLYNFVDLHKFKPQDMLPHKGEYREKLNITDTDFVVGFAGRIIRRKGWRTFIEAARIATIDNPHIHFLIAGNGADREDMLAMIEAYQLSKQVHYLGYVNNMLAFYAALDCFAMPSHFEGLPMTQLEVMALGVPLITADGPGMDEIPQDGSDALYMEMKNPEDLAAKIKQLAQEPQLRTFLCDNAMQTVQEHSLDNYVKSLYHIYETLN